MNVYDFTVTDNKGNVVSLKEYEGAEARKDRMELR